MRQIGRYSANNLVGLVALLVALGGVEFLTQSVSAVVRLAKGQMVALSTYQDSSRKTV